MSYILLIETATETCCIALALKDKVVAQRLVTKQKAHAGVINVFIKEVLQDAGINFDKLDAIAVSSGPGSYTGLRIGVSTAKGLCFAIDKPLIAIDTLLSYAHQYYIENKSSLIHPQNTLFIPMIDARRMEVYTAVYNQNFETIVKVNALVLQEDSFLEYENKFDLHFFGDGAPKIKSFLKEKASIIVKENFIPNAAGMAVLAHNKLLKQEYENLAYFEPFYLKDFVTQSKFR
nr:tRNA (adenosine(37)-N6)-threonylcarbamoyltransferase complex dimerization subunit type 1 TsaB [Bacteroidota bacterium]